MVHAKTAYVQGRVNHTPVTDGMLWHCHFFQIRFYEKLLNEMAWNFVCVLYPRYIFEICQKFTTSSTEFFLFAIWKLKCPVRNTFWLVSRQNCKFSKSFCRKSAVGIFKLKKKIHNQIPWSIWCSKGFKEFFNKYWDIQSQTEMVPKNTLFFPFLA